MLPADRLLLERLGARLRQLREDAKLTQEQLAERAGFGGKYVGEIEKGIRDVPLSTLRAVVENGLGLQLDAVFSGKGGCRKVKVVAHPRDVEITAGVISQLPMNVRRPLLSLLKAFSTKSPKR